MTGPTVRFAVAHINHHHIYAQVDMLLTAGAELVALHAQQDELANPFLARYPWVTRVATESEVVATMGTPAIR